jgi:serine phosphatase RsbU (regulator of sigma subunit)
MFGFDRLERLVRHLGHLEPADLLERLLSAIHGFTEGRVAHDDMTLVVVRVNP